MSDYQPRHAADPHEGDAFEATVTAANLEYIGRHRERPRSTYVHQPEAVYPLDEAFLAFLDSVERDEPTWDTWAHRDEDAS